MDQIFGFINTLPTWAILAVFVVAMAILGKSADILVEQAVVLSLKLAIPTAVIGATVLSLGTTTPEVVVSVMAAVRGNPGLALGNAVGSVICDTGLILGLVCVIGPLKVVRKDVNLGAWIQVASAFLLIGFCLPWSSLSSTFTTGGVLSQQAGWFFLALLVVYMVFTIMRAKGSKSVEEDVTHVHLGKTLLKVFGCIVVVITASEALIHAASELAIRASIPESIVAATLVAFGTSLPELVTALVALKKGQSELAVGNVIGADILNVLFVAGAAASVTPLGLKAPPHFFTLLFPAMIAVILIFRISIYFSKPIMPRIFGFLMLGGYFVVTIQGFLQAFK